MAYSELIKNFDNIREYMRQFYVYGFKSRNEYDAKSTRSYDNERRRIESWLGDYMCFRNDNNGKIVFLSVDSRAAHSNPLYNAYKAKSFTSGDITFHFYIFDLLADSKARSIGNILQGFTDNYMSLFEHSQEFDESTIRKKLKEYVNLGLLKSEKCGKEVLYSINKININLNSFKNAVSFFSEVSPIGVVGSYISDRYEKSSSPFCFKHHYILNAIDSQVTYRLLTAIHEKRFAEITTKDNLSIKVFPFKIYISTQNGRQYVLCWKENTTTPLFFRIDNINTVKSCEKCTTSNDYNTLYDNVKNKIWGVSLGDRNTLEKVELKIHICDNESFIVERLEREKRCGKIERIDSNTYLFTAEIYDANELLPWLRTFIGRIQSFKCSNSSVTERFYADLNVMYELYGGE